MNEITPLQPEPLRSSMLAVIARAASDERVDIDKMTALLAMQRDIDARAAQTEFDIAMDELNRRCEMRVGKAGIASLGSKGSYKFAKWEDLDAVVRPIMREVGLRFSFKSRTDQFGVTVTGYLHHSGGHAESTEVTLPVDTGPGRNPMQQVGSTISYGKRYCAELLLNVVREDEDDDGQAGGQRAPRQPNTVQMKPEPPLAFVDQAERDLENEPNGTKWLKLLGDIMRQVTSMDDVAAINAFHSVVESRRNAPAAIKSIIDDLFRQTSKRLAPQPDPEPEADSQPEAGKGSAMPWSDEQFEESLTNSLSSIETLADLIALTKDADYRNSMQALRESSPKTYGRLLGLVDARRIELEAEQKGEGNA